MEIQKSSEKKMSRIILDRICDSIQQYLKMKPVLWRKKMEAKNQKRSLLDDFTPEQLSATAYIVQKVRENPEWTPDQVAQAVKGD